MWKEDFPSFPTGGVWGHTATAVDDCIYVHGGRIAHTGAFLDRTYLFNTVSSKWRHISVEGDSPAPRTGHSCSLVNRCLYIFGGISVDGTPFNDLYVLDCDVHIWSSPPTIGDVPAARHGHAAAVIDDCIWIFSGCGVSSYYGDVHCLHVAEMRWSRVETQGSPPSPRAFFTASLCGRRFYILGGIGEGKECPSESYILDADTNQWSLLRFVGLLPLARAGHATIVHDHHLHLIGGFNHLLSLSNDMIVIDSDSHRYTSVPTPIPLRSFSAGDASRGKIFVVGGIFSWKSGSKGYPCASSILRILCGLKPGCAPEDVPDYELKAFSDVFCYSPDKGQELNQNLRSRLTDVYNKSLHKIDPAKNNMKWLRTMKRKSFLPPQMVIREHIHDVGEMEQTIKQFSEINKSFEEITSVWKHHERNIESELRSARRLVQQLGDLNEAQSLKDEISNLEEIFNAERSSLNKDEVLLNKVQKKLVQDYNSYSTFARKNL